MRLITVCLLCVSVGQVAAQEKKKTVAPDRVLKPFLWKLDTKTPSYVLGTMHVADKRVLKLHPLVEAAFKSADVAMFEIDLEKGAPAQMRAIAMPPGKKPEDFVPEDLLNRLQKRVKAVGSPIPMRALKPIVWPLIISQIDASTKYPGTPLDLHLYRRAKADGKTVGGLEDPATQLDALFKMSRKEQVEFITSTLDSLDKADDEEVDPLAKMLGHYLTGDSKQFMKFFMDDLKSGGLSEGLQAKFVDAILTGRNQKMAENILKETKNSPEKKHFFAVGTAHLLGEKTVFDYLKKKGISAIRVSK